MEACKKGGMKLLSFFKKDTEETTAVMKLLSDYRATRSKFLKKYANVFKKTKINCVKILSQNPPTGMR